MDNRGAMAEFVRVCNEERKRPGERPDCRARPGDRHSSDRYREYKKDLDALATIFATNPDGGKDDLIETVRRLVAEVIIRAAPGGGPVAIEVKGRLAELIGYDAFPKRTGE